MPKTKNNIIMDNSYWLLGGLVIMVLFFYAVVTIIDLIQEKNEAENNQIQTRTR